MSGGMPEYIRAGGLPIFTTDSEFDITEGAVDRALAPVQWNEMLEKNPNALIVDARTADEITATNKMEGAVNIDNLAADFDDIAKAIFDEKGIGSEDYILVYCAAGIRSGPAADKIAALGYDNVFFLNNAVIWDADGTYRFF